MMSPPLPSFTFIDPLLKLGAEVYLVGGSVRDLFLKRPHKDFDFLVAKLPYPQLLDALKKLGRVNQVGKSFGVTKFRPHLDPETEIDLSLPRLEKSTGLGHREFEVCFDPFIPIQEDLKRRDFTINAMALNLANGSLVDPFDGKKDLEAQTLKLVFEKAFEEDPLRLMRAVQFAARFHLTVHPETKESMAKFAPLIRTVSRERIIDEIAKLFLSDKPSLGFNLMRETSLLGIVFPFIEKMIGILQPNKKNEDVYQHTMKVLDASKNAAELEKPGDLNLMFAALLHDSGKPRTYRRAPETNEVTFFGHQNVSKRIAKSWLGDFKATGIGLDVPKVLTLIENHMFETKAFFSDKAIRRFVNKVGLENIFDLVDLRIADKKGGRFPDSMKGILNLRNRIREEINKKPPFGPKDLAINGHDLIAMGFKPGPLLGKIQKFLVEKVLDEPRLNTEKELKKWVKENFHD
jgi:putative nucleotidyltransferase with HDIG domain